MEIHVISKQMKLKTKCSFLDKTQTICVSPVRNKENEFHRDNPIEKNKVFVSENCNVVFNVRKVK